ncbi:MAG: hypothetical protein K0S26_1085 [Bacteroidota bacterium]|jgi:DNA-binding LytR/AlgR family response regulator|nr:hypothetical protein [Bacteroidota bacterium]
MKTRVVLIDDDYSALKALKNYCEQLDLTVVQAFDSPTSFINSIEDLKFDLAILDYAMPQFDGVQLAQVINSTGIPVIFVTGHLDDIAKTAWGLNCIACIEKPVTIDKIKNAIQKFSGSTNHTSAFISLNIYGGAVARIKVSDIAYITSCSDDSSGNDKTLVVNTGTRYRIVKKKIEELMAILPHKQFMRISRSEIVAKDSIHIHTKNHEELTLNLKDNKGPIKLYVSSPVKEDFKKWYQG